MAEVVTTRGTEGPSGADALPADLVAAPARGRRAGRLRSTLGWAPVVGVGLLVAAAAIGPALVGADPRDVDLTAVLEPPSREHPLGTDSSGRDVLQRSLSGLRVSLVVGLVAALAAGLVGTVVGVLAGTLGGWVDRVTMRLVDAIAAVPHLLLGIFVVALFRPSLGAVVASVALTHWVSTARVVRAVVLSVRERDYVDAAVVAGASRWSLARRHHVPAVAPHALLAWSLMVPHAIMHESALSFLGLGLPPHLPSLGTMIASGQGALLAGQWWPALVPGAFVVALGLCTIGATGRLRSRWSARLPSEERW